MTDQTEEQTTTVAAGEEDSGSSNMQQGTPTPEVDETTKKLDKMSVSLSIWPPTQRTRDAVIKRLIQTLSEKSVLSDRYGALPADEAAAVARRIEEEALNVASNAPPASAEDDGIEILQSYSKEISKRMLETVKSRSGGKDAATADDSAEERSVVETLS